MTVACESALLLFLCPGEFPRHAKDSLLLYYCPGIIMKKKRKDEIRNAGREEQMNRGRGREEGKN